MPSRESNIKVASFTKQKETNKRCYMSPPTSKHNGKQIKEGKTKSKRKRGALTCQFLSLSLQGHSEHDKWVFRPWQ